MLVLVDGHPFIGRISGQVDLARIPTSMIERVEVVKGPQSSLYGSDAMGGVVNVITRRADLPGWETGLDVRLGTQGRSDAAANVRARTGALSVVADVGRRRDVETGASSDQWDGLLKLAWSPDSALLIEASAMLLDERQRWHGGQLFHFADNRQRSVRVGGDWSRGAHRVVPAIYATEFDHLSRRAAGRDPVPGTGEREVQRLVEADVLYHASAAGHPFELGIEAKREETVSDRVQGRRRTLHSVEPFAQVTWSVGALSLVPGARLSWSQEWGSYWTPRIAALYRPVPALAIRGTVGRGFRAPHFKEMYMEFLNIGAGHGYTVRGNADLRPETSTNVSAGAEWSAGRLYLRAQAYRNRFEDFIETRLVGDSSGIAVYSYGNIGSGETRGIDVDAGFTHGALRAEAGYGYLEAHQAETREPLLGRPTHSGRALLEYTMAAGVRGALVGHYMGATPVRRTEAGVEERSGYMRLDARLSKSLPRDFEVTLGARNILDSHPDSWPGFTGRQVHLGIGWEVAGGD